MKIIFRPNKKKTVLLNHNHYFKTMIKAVVDVKRGILALDAELHADLESLLLSQDSSQQDLWGINLYLKKSRDEWIEYTALINIRPSVGNRSMEVEKLKLRKRIAAIVFKLITE